MDRRQQHEWQCAVLFMCGVWICRGSVFVYPYYFEIRTSKWTKLIPLILWVLCCLSLSLYLCTFAADVSYSAGCVCAWHEPHNRSHSYVRRTHTPSLTHISMRLCAPNVKHTEQKRGEKEINEMKHALAIVVVCAFFSVHSNRSLICMRCSLLNMIF